MYCLSYACNHGPLPEIYTEITHDLLLFIVAQGIF
jgi:hypothetical protein